MQKAIKLHRCTKRETKKKHCSRQREQKMSCEGELNYRVIHPSPGDDRHEDKKHEEEEDDSFRRRLYRADGAAPHSALCCAAVSFLSAPPSPRGAAHVSPPSWPGKPTSCPCASRNGRDVDVMHDFNTSFLHLEFCFFFLFYILIKFISIY